MSEHLSNPCHCCGAPTGGRFLTLTERDPETAAVGVWRVCSWECLGALARRKVCVDR